MFVPSVESLMNALKIDKSELNGDGQVTVPARLLRLLLQIAVATTEFDEDAYLRRNPDVAMAIYRGEIESGRLHYIGFGYFEGRQGGGPDVDENWYLQRYPDVAAAVRTDKISSVAEHFFLWVEEKGGVLILIKQRAQSSGNKPCSADV
jgi:hypothetical protein